MLKRLIFFLIIMLSAVSQIAMAQSPTFSKVYYDIQQVSIEARAAVNSFDNGYVIAGKGDYGNGLILKLDSAGNEEWNTVIGESVNNYPRIVFNSIIQTKDSCYLLAGSAYNANTTETEAFCVKINQTGDTLWTRTINADNYPRVVVQSVYQTLDSGYVMTGDVTQNPTPNNLIFAAKIDKLGNLEWSTVIGDGNQFNYGHSIKETPDNGYILSAALQACCPWNYGTFLIKLSSTGSIDWSRKYYREATEPCSGYDVMVLDDGFLCLMRLDYYTALMKTDFGGNVTWAKHYSSYVFSDMAWPAPRINTMPDTSFVFTCADAMLKVDTSGNPLLSSSFTLNTVGMTATEDNGFFIFGNGPGLGAKTQVLWPHIGVIKLDSVATFQDCTWPNTVTSTDITMQTSSHTFTSYSGGVESRIHPYENTLTLTSYSGCIDFTGAITMTDTNTVAVYPNPVNNYLTIEATAPGDLKIYNTQGQLVTSSLVKEPLTTIDVSSFASGLYYLTLQSKEGVITKKVEVVR